MSCLSIVRKERFLARWTSRSEQYANVVPCTAYEINWVRASIRYIRDQKFASCLNLAYILGGRDRATIDFAKKTDWVGLPPPAMIENMRPTSIHQASGLLKAPTTFIKVQREYRWSVK